jgi:hypothetical protein
MRNEHQKLLQMYTKGMSPAHSLVDLGEIIIENLNEVTIGDLVEEEDLNL